MSQTECQKEHRYDAKFKVLPHDQGGAGRHRCAACAYDKGYNDGLERREILELNLDRLPISQAGDVRHKSPHAAYAKGYYDGVAESYR